MDKLKIDPEFRDKIPAMPKEDFEGLRADILRDGYIRDPLVVWKEENTLLDGHHRWTVICENWELLKDKYTIDYKSFPDRWAAIAWICANQLHKHNMTELQRAKLIQEEYEARQRTKGGDHKSEAYKKQSGENLHFDSESLIDGTSSPFEYKTGKEPKTREIIAKEHNISPGEVKSAVEVGRGIDRAAQVDPEFKREVLSGEVKASKKDLAEIRKMESDEAVSAMIEEIRNTKRERKQNANSRGYTKEDRAERAKTEAIVADMYDASSVPEFTLDFLLEDIDANGMEYVSMLRNTLIDRSTLLTEENKPSVAFAIEKIINEIQKVKELVKA